MSPSSRPSRLAAQRAEEVVGEIARQEEETRAELSNIAQQAERTADIERLPSRIVTFRFSTAQGRQALQNLAAVDPDGARPVRPFETLRFSTVAGRERFAALVGKLTTTSPASAAPPPPLPPAASFSSVGHPIGHATTAPARFTTPEAQVIAQWDAAPASAESMGGSDSSSMASTILKAVQTGLGEWQPPPDHIRIHMPTQRVIIVPSIDDAEHSSREMTDPFVDPQVTDPILTSQYNYGDVRRADSNATFIIKMDVPAELEHAKGPEPEAECLDTKEDVEKPPFRDFMLDPPRDLPEHKSYRVGPEQNQRLMKYQKPPNGWTGTVTSHINTDYSDPRYWEAPTVAEQDAVWRMLHPTVTQFARITRQEFSREQATSLPWGYMCQYDQIHWKLSEWCFANMARTHPWIMGGKLTCRLFRLERWYGLIEDYEFSPNWPRRLRDPCGRVVQNPDCFACTECVRADVLCHGHREDYKARCVPCLQNGRNCSKEWP